MKPRIDEAHRNQLAETILLLLLTHSEEMRKAAPDEIALRAYDTAEALLQRKAAIKRAEYAAADAAYAARQEAIAHDAMWSPGAD